MNDLGNHDYIGTPAGLSAELLGKLAEQTGVGILNWHLPTGEIRLNRQIAQLTGYEMSEIPHSGASRESLILPEDLKMVTEHIDDCIEGRRDGYKIEYRMHRRDGSIVSFLESAIVTERNESGKAERIAAMSLDLSNIKWLEQKHRDLERQYRLISEGTSQDSLVRQNRLLHACNSAAALLIGGIYDDYETTLSHSLQIIGDSLLADRGHIWRNREDENGQFTCFMRAQWSSSYFYNVPEIGANTAVYDEIMPRWRELTPETEPRCGCVEDFDEKLLAGLNMTQSNRIMLIPLFMHGAFWGMIVFERLGLDESFTMAEADIVRSGSLILASSISRWETFAKLSEAREEALNSTRAKSDFLSRMSHEIRTPMNAIIGMSSIARKSTDPERIAYCIDKIDTASRQLLSLINDVLDMSKIEADKFEISEAPFDFDNMLQNVLSVTQHKMEEKNHEFLVDISGEFTKSMVSDELRLSQVLINLITNSVKFTPEKGRITLRIREKKTGENSSRMRFEVEDTGIGISEEGISKLFVSFQQADGSITRKFGGTGLGLAICKKIISLMGGDIWVESQLGRGSRFIFEIDTKWENSKSLRENKIDLNDFNVLVVDDSQDTLDYFDHVLQGFAVEHGLAKGGYKAIERVKESIEEGNPYNLVFIDWFMPDMDGGETAKAVTKLLGGDVVVVMISSGNWDEIKRRVKEIGIHQFLPKPILPSTLYNFLAGFTKVQKNRQDSLAQYRWPEKRILLAEDIEINREIVNSMLEDTGLVIDYAEDGQRAFQMVSEGEQQYDLVLMDMQMPVTDGITATKLIRSIGTEYAEKLPIIAMTANAFKEDADKCFKAGMNDHIPKPVDVAKLLKVIDKYLKD